MYLGDPISNLAAALYSAVYKDMPDVEEETLDYSQGYEKARELPKIKVTRRPRSDEIRVYAMFPQSWASTALGFGGIGGAAISEAYTIVLYNGINDYVVYFAGRAAYRVNDPDRRFFEDISNQDLASVQKAAGIY